MTPYISYDQKTNLVTFSDEFETSAKYANKSFKIGIDLIDWEGYINSYVQTVLLWKKDYLDPKNESQVQDEPSSDAIVI